MGEQEAVEDSVLQIGIVTNVVPQDVLAASQLVLNVVQKIQEVQEEIQVEQTIIVVFRQIGIVPNVVLRVVLEVNQLVLNVVPKIQMQELEETVE